MKKFALIASLAASFFAASALQAQTATTTTTTGTSTRRARATVSTRNNTKVTSRLRQIERNSTTITTTQPATRLDGGAVRTVRSGNPLQMVNPFAPKEYGNGNDVTRHEVDDPYQRPQGLQLFAVQF